MKRKPQHYTSAMIRDIERERVRVRDRDWQEMKKQYRKEIREALSVDNETLIKSVKHYILKHPGASDSAMMWHGRMKGIRLVGFRCSVGPESEGKAMYRRLNKAIKTLLDRGEIAEGEALKGPFGQKPGYSQWKGKHYVVTPLGAASHAFASLGGKARAKKYDKATLSKWAKKGGRPRSAALVH